MPVGIVQVGDNSVGSAGWRQQCWQCRLETTVLAVQVGDNSVGRALKLQCSRVSHTCVAAVAYAFSLSNALRHPGW